MIQFDETAITDLHDCGDTVATEVTRKDAPRPPGVVTVGDNGAENDTSTLGGDTDTLTNEALNQLLAKLTAEKEKRQADVSEGGGNGDG